MSHCHLQFKVNVVFLNSSLRAGNDRHVLYNKNIYQIWSILNAMLNARPLYSIESLLYFSCLHSALLMLQLVLKLRSDSQMSCRGRKAVSQAVSRGLFWHCALRGDALCKSLRLLSMWLLQALWDACGCTLMRCPNAPPPPPPCEREPFLVFAYKQALDCFRVYTKRPLYGSKTPFMKSQKCKLHVHAAL